MRESALQAAVMNALTWHPKVAWCFVTSNGMVKRGNSRFMVGKIGLPDILGQLKGIHGGVTFGIEIKVPGQKPTEAQEKFLDMIRANGGVAGWCTSVEEALEILK